MQNRWNMGAVLICAALALCWPVSACDVTYVVMDSTVPPGGGFTRSSMGKLAAECAKNIGVGLDSIGPHVWLDTSDEIVPAFHFSPGIRKHTTDKVTYYKPYWVEAVDSIIPSPPDTLRQYPVVDTCLTCPDGFSLVLADTLRLALTYAATGTWCIDITFCEIIIECPDTSITTTWLPKVQVWLTPEDADKWECFKADGHDTGGFRVKAGSSIRIICTRCKAEVER